MYKKYFDLVMSHIEENVDKPNEEIECQIPNLTGRYKRTFGEIFYMLTGCTLRGYIKQRRLYYASKDLVFRTDKSISDIALDYQFSDQSAFSRAIKEKYGVTPGEIRKNGFRFDEERFYFDDVVGKKPDTQVERILRHLETRENILLEDMELILQIEHLNEEYGFDIGTCYKIADLAERLNVPTCCLGHQCILAMADYQIPSTNIPSDVEFMARGGFESLDEMYAMCEHFKCEYYELDEVKIYRYRKLMKQQGQ